MRKELPIICKLIAFLAVMLVATGCSSLNNRANENIKYATMNGLGISALLDEFIVGEFLLALPLPQSLSGVSEPA